MLIIEQIPVLSDNYIYLLHDQRSEQTAVVDPAVSAPVLAKLQKYNWRLTHILNTHHHHDHTGANLELKQQTGCNIYASYQDQQRIPGIDVALQDNELLPFGDSVARILFTPGHTSGHIVYYFADENALFCGDTLFVMGCGRLFEGSPQQMLHSLNKLKALPPSTRIFCAHEYTQSNGRFALSLEPDNKDIQLIMRQVQRARDRNQATVPSTLQQEMISNPFLRAGDDKLQEAMGLQGYSELQVFTETRRLKDHF